MRVMICQPDAGEDTAAWAMADRARVMVLLESLGHQICEEIAGQDDAPAEGNTALWLLGKIFQVMASADAVYFMDGWTTDPKCRIAFAACMLLGRKAINANFHQLGDGYTSLLYYWIKNTPENIQRENLRCDVCGHMGGDIWRIACQSVFSSEGLEWFIYDKYRMLCDEHQDEAQNTYVLYAEPGHVGMLTFKGLKWEDIDPTRRHLVYEVMKSCIKGYEAKFPLSQKPR